MVADQLRISDGWVRCGRCQEVFDATQALQEVVPPATPVPQGKVATEAAPAAQQPAEMPASAAPEASYPSLSEVHAKLRQAVEPEPEPAPAPAPAPAAQGYELPVPPDAADDIWLDAPVQDAPIAQRMPGRAPHAALEPREPRLEPEVPQPVVQSEREVFSGAALPGEEAQAMDWADAWQAGKQGAVSESADETPVVEAREAEQQAPEAQQTGDELDAGDAPIPSFVKQAQRKAWWNKPAVRFVMGMLLIFLPLSLALQVAVQERNTLVAWKPQWRPAFESMCLLLRCELAPRRDIASVVLTGSSFHQEAQAHRYQLGLSIQNQGALAVATPAVELTLTDTQDQVLVRKVFTPQEIGAPEELAARSEWNGTLPLQTQGLNLPVSGYRVMAFYP